jgi:hypothetical protein
VEYFRFCSIVAFRARPDRLVVSSTAWRPLVGVASLVVLAFLAMLTWNLLVGLFAGEGWQTAAGVLLNLVFLVFLAVGLLVLLGGLAIAWLTMESGCWFDFDRRCGQLTYSYPNMPLDIRSSHHPYLVRGTVPLTAVYDARIDAFPDSRLKRDATGQVIEEDCSHFWVRVRLTDGTVLVIEPPGGTEDLGWARNIQAQINEFVGAPERGHAEEPPGSLNRWKERQTDTDAAGRTGTGQ